MAGTTFLSKRLFQRGLGCYWGTLPTAISTQGCGPCSILEYLFLAALYEKVCLDPLPTTLARCVLMPVTVLQPPLCPRNRINSR